MLDPTFLKDAAERVIASFLEAVLGLIVAGGVSGLNASTAHVLLGAGLAAAFATLKTILAAQTGGTVSPASLVKKTKHKAADAGVTIVEACFCIVLLVIALVILFHYVH